MQNVWIYRMNSDTESRIIEYFTGNGMWDKVIWHDNEFIRRRYGENPLYQKYDAFTYHHVPDELHDYVNRHFYTFLDMYVRWSPWSSNIYDQKNIHDYLNIFNRYVSFTYSTLVTENISLVVFNRAPHLGGDFLLYLIAEYLGIRTLLLEQSKFVNKFFHYFDLWDFGDFNTSKVIRDVPAVEIEKSFRKNLVYMNEIYNNKNKPRETFKNYFYDEYRFIVESLHSEGWQQSLYRYNLRKQFKKDSKSILSDKTDLDRPFVYFALHKQPEQTTSVWGGKYCDQVLAIEKLSELLPEDWVIYVKENPIQDFYMRGRYFYDRIRLIPNVMFVPPDTDTYTLLEKCQFASTVTGTVGWEAITGGKNVLVFGWGTWYKTLPGVFEYKEDIDINDIIASKIDHSELELKVAELQSKMGEGYIYKADTKEYEHYDNELNKETVVRELENILYS
jgi:hypothetical protein